MGYLCSFYQESRQIFNLVESKKVCICISFAVPRRGGVHQAPSLLPRRQVEGDGGAQDQATLQTQNCKLFPDAIYVF